jgi:hypothetical protein
MGRIQTIRCDGGAVFDIRVTISPSNTFELCERFKFS